MSSKTNATRMLDRAGVAYEVLSFAVDEQDLTAETAARKLGLLESQVFKTLVVRGAKTGVHLAVVPAGHALDLKAFAKLVGDRRVEMVPLKEVQPLTGYIRGAVTALATRKPLNVVLDTSAMSHERVGVSAGARGTEIVLAPDDYVQVTGAQVAAIARKVHKD